MNKLLVIILGLLTCACMQGKSHELKSPCVAVDSKDQTIYSPCIKRSPVYNQLS